MKKYIRVKSHHRVVNGKRIKVRAYLRRAVRRKKVVLYASNKETGKRVKVEFYAVVRKADEDDEEVDEKCQK